MNMCFISTEWRFSRIVRAEIDESSRNGSNKRHWKTLIQSFDAFVFCDFENIFDEKIS